MPRRKKTGHKPGPMSKALAVATQRQILKRYTKGRTVDEIATELNLLPKTVDKHLNAALDKAVRHWSKPSPEHTFVRYAAFQIDIIDKLQKSYDAFMGDEDNRQYGAAISALRAQSDIMDKVMGKGTELGVITQRKADRTISMSRADLRLELQREIETLASLLDKVDNHETFTRRRAAALRKAGTPTRRYLARIRKVKRNALGFVTALPDWKFKPSATNDDGSPITVIHPAPAPNVMPIEESATQIDIAVLDQDDRLLAEYQQQKRSRLKAHTQQQRPPKQQTTKEQKHRPGYEFPTDYGLAEPST